jgi:hypothetical protein
LINDPTDGPDSQSRKVLWEDEPHHPFATFHSGKENLTSIINPNKYINVPDEWYNMPADQKYTMKYVTMAILKEEQEYMMQELKNGPVNFRYTLNYNIDWLNFIVFNLKLYLYCIRTIL